MRTTYGMGLSIGHSHEPAAVAIVGMEGEGAGATFALLHLERFLSAKVADIGSRVAALLRSAPLYERRVDYRPNERYPGAVRQVTVERYAPLSIEATGASRAAIQTLEAALPPGVWASVFVLSNGDTEVHARQQRIPRRDFAGALQMHFEARRLRWSRELPYSDALAAQLAAFRVKPRAGTLDSDLAYREGKDDDLVLCVAAAVRAVERSGPIMTAEVLRDFLGARGWQG